MFSTIIAVLALIAAALLYRRSVKMIKWAEENFTEIENAFARVASDFATSDFRTNMQFMLLGAQVEGEAQDLNERVSALEAQLAPELGEVEDATGEPLTPAGQGFPDLTVL